jgi:hypothetical protein
MVPPDLRSEPRVHHRHLLATLLAGGALLAVRTIQAEDAGLGLTSRTAVEYNAVFTGGDDADEPASPDTRIATDTRLFYDAALAGKATWRAGVRLLGYAYSALDELDEIRIAPELTVRVPLDEGDRLDLGLSATYRQRGASFVSLAWNGRATWNRRIDARWSWRATIEAGWTDFDEAYDPDLDQTRLAANAVAVWRPFADHSFVSAQLGYARVEAELGRLSYDRYTLDLRGRWAITGDDTLDARAAWNGRVYAGDYSADYPFAREDDRWDLSLSYTRTVAPGVGLFAEAGYTVNRSNVDIESYDGPSFSAGITLSF